MTRRTPVTAALLAATVSLGCLSEITVPPPGPAFTTDAGSYVLVLGGTSRTAVIAWTYQDESGGITALQGCTGGIARWTLEKQVSGEWREVYPVCTANDAAGTPVVAGGSSTGEIFLVDLVAEGGSPRISHRPIAGTYRIRFHLFENLNFVTGTGEAVTDGRQYSNTFTLSEG